MGTCPHGGRRRNGRRPHRSDFLRGACRIHSEARILLRLHMSTWAANPTWQNFSSLFREAVTAQEAKTGMEKSHHLTASLYFGVAALEAFLNDKMRAHLKATKSEEEIFDVLRKGRIISKLRKWPTELLGKQLNLNDGTLDLIAVFNDVRGDLTHPKTHGQDIYARLDRKSTRLNS